MYTGSSFSAPLSALLHNDFELECWGRKSPVEPVTKDPEVPWGSDDWKRWDQSGFCPTPVEASKKKNPDTWGEDMGLQGRTLDGGMKSGDSHTQAEPLEVDESHTSHLI